MILGTWESDDLRRAFVEGAAWWEYHHTGFTMWPSDRSIAENMAELKYPNGKPCLSELPLDNEQGKGV